jgi:predicted kinase
VHQHDHDSCEVLVWLPTCHGPIVSGSAAVRKMTDQDRPLLVVVTGPPASGKTTIARAIAREFRLPLVAKDGIKELLFDELGTGDRDWSRRLGRATIALMYRLLDEQLRAGCSVVVEANFRPELANSSFAALPAHRVFQVYCTAPDELLVERYASRPRHPGHLDEQVLDELRGDALAGYAPLALGGELIELDTRSDVDLGALFDRVRAMH